MKLCYGNILEREREIEGERGREREKEGEGEREREGELVREIACSNLIVHARVFAVV